MSSTIYCFINTAIYSIACSETAGQGWRAKVPRPLLHLTWEVPTRMGWGRLQGSPVGQRAALTRFALWLKSSLDRLAQMSREVPSPFCQIGLGSQSPTETALVSLYPKSQHCWFQGCWHTSSLCLLVQTHLLVSTSSPLKPLKCCHPGCNDPEKQHVSPEITAGAWS